MPLTTHKGLTEGAVAHGTQITKGQRQVPQEALPALPPWKRWHLNVNS